MPYMKQIFVEDARMQRAPTKKSTKKILDVKYICQTLCIFWSVQWFTTIGVAWMTEQTMVELPPANSHARRGLCRQILQSLEGRRWQYLAETPQMNESEMGQG